MSTQTEVSLLPSLAAFLRTPRKLLIDGHWVEALSGKTFATYNPANGEVLTQVAEGDEQDINLAVKKLHAARWRVGPGPLSHPLTVEN